MTDSKLIDSSLWLAYFFNGNGKEIIESDQILLLSAMSLFEIERKLHKEKVPLAQVRKSMDFIKSKSLVIHVTADIAEKAVLISLKHNLAAIDSIIYATALNQLAILITLDNDFRGLQYVLIPSKE